MNTDLTGNPAALRVRALHPHFGAQALDIDLSVPVSDRQIEALRDAYDRYQLLLFRGGARLDPLRQVEIAGWFGPPVANGGDGRLWSVLHNDEAAGRVRLPFHSDLSYTEAPIEGISLHALELPPHGTTTSFVSGVHAWSTLAPDRQRLLSAMSARHRLSSKLYGDWPEFIAEHPVRLVHPRTGIPVLYVTEHHVDHLLGLDEQDSDRLLTELFGHLYAPRNIYTHHWEHGDLLIWDNRAIQHARIEEADRAGGARAMQRVALGDVPYDELVERARRAERQRARPA